MNHTASSASSAPHNPPTATPSAPAPPTSPYALVGIHPRPGDALAQGVSLLNGTYRLGQVLGRGGFGITYIGADTHLRRVIAIKEFFPLGECQRNGNQVVASQNGLSATLEVAR